jgi:hypothetical protein
MASERSRHSDSKVDEVLILDKRTQYFIMFRRTSRKRGYLPSSPITALFVAFFPTLIEYLHSLKCAFSIIRPLQTLVDNFNSAATACDDPCDEIFR